MAKLTRKKLLDSSVEQDKDGTWTATCPVDNGCGVVGGVGYQFRYAPTKALAQDRLAAHFDEHLTGEPIEPIDQWRARHGLIADADGRGVTLADLEA
jgi:hypothetical protein